MRRERYEFVEPSKKRFAVRGGYDNRGIVIL
jgi:hypothetical protein